MSEIFLRLGQHILGVKGHVPLSSEGFLEIRTKGKPDGKVAIVLKSNSPTFHQYNFQNHVTTEIHAVAPFYSQSVFSVQITKPLLLWHYKQGKESLSCPGHTLHF